MKKHFLNLILIALLLLSQPALQAQRKKDKPSGASKATTPAQRGIDQITAAQMRNYLSFIASDEMEGRDTPSRGLDTTAKFIALNLGRWGFKPAGDSSTFLQRIVLRRDHIDASKTKVELNGQQLVTGDDYIPSSTAGSVSGQMVFAGNGWFIKSKNVDAYKDVDAKGKIAVIFGTPNTFPRGARRSELGKQGEDYLSPVDYARKVGVAGIVYVPDFQFLANWDRNRQRIMERGSTLPEKFLTATPTSLPSITISPRVANALFQGEKQNATALFEQTYAAGGTIPASFALSAEKTITINVFVKNESVPTQNIVAIWEGSDPVLKNEYVATGAHYDHVGTTTTPVNGDWIYNGADDDGSGTTALLSIAEALARAPMRPKRSVLFVWHCGEEKGLWGSRYFTDYPTVPLETVITQLNIDMIGRSKKAGDTNPRNANLTGPNDIYVIGHNMMSSELGELTESVNKGFLNLGFDYRYDDPADPNRFFFRSDHYNYARKGIPIVFFFDGVHEDYHQLGDSPDKIDYDKMEKVTRTIYMMLWELANRPTRPKVDKPLPAQLAN